MNIWEKTCKTFGKKEHFEIYSAAPSRSWGPLVSVVVRAGDKLQLLGVPQI